MHGASRRLAACWIAGAALVASLATGNAAHAADGEPTAAANPSTAPPLPVQQLAPGVYLQQGAVEDWGPTNLGRVSNIGFIVGERCIAVVDSGGSLPVGRGLRAAIRQVSPLPVCYVINTHAHPDHVLGNGAFAGSNGGADPAFVGHHRLPAALASRGPFYLNALRRDFGPTQAATPIVSPTQTVQDTLEIDLGRRKLLLRAWPTAHTDADLTVFDATNGTLWLGDLLFASHTPVVDGKLKGWLAVMAELRPLPVRVAIPGHGAPSSDWPGALAPQQAYLEGLLRDVRKAVKDGLTLSQAMERIAPASPGGWQLLEVFHRRNVSAAYAELEWED